MDATPSQKIPAADTDQIDAEQCRHGKTAACGAVDGSAFQHARGGRARGSDPIRAVAPGIGGIVVQVGTELNEDARDKRLPTCKPMDLSLDGPGKRSPDRDRRGRKGP